MPDLEQEALGEGLAAPILPNINGIDVPERASFTEQWSEYVRRNNEVYNLINYAQSSDSDPHEVNFDRVRDYDAMTKAAAAGVSPEELTEFLFVDNDKDFEDTKSRLQIEYAQRADIEARGGVGITAALVAEFSSPTTYIPVIGWLPKAFKAGKVAKGALEVSTSWGGAMALREGILQGTQNDRTAEESAYSIASAMVIGSLVGGGVAKLGDTALQKKVDTYLKNDQKVGTTLKDVVDYNKSIGAAQTNPPLSLDELGILGNDNIVKDSAFQFWKAASKYISPTLKVMEGSFPANKEAIEKLAHFDLAIKAHEGQALPAAVEDVIGISNGRFAKATISAKSHYVNHVTQSKAAGKTPLTQAEFDKELHWALLDGDVHNDPFVAKAIKDQRDFMEWGYKTAEDSGLDIKRQTLDKSYGGMFVPNKPMIREHTNTWYNKLRPSAVKVARSILDEAKKRLEKAEQEHVELRGADVFKRESSIKSAKLDLAAAKEAVDAELLEHNNIISKYINKGGAQITDRRRQSLTRLQEQVQQAFYRLEDSKAKLPVREETDELINLREEVRRVDMDQDNIAEEFITASTRKILGLDSYSPTEKIVVELRKGAHERTFQVPVRDIFEFAEHDRTTLNRMFARSMSADSAIQRNFGTTNIGKIAEDLATKGQSQIDKLPDGPAKAQALKDLKNEISTIEHEFEVIRGTYKPDRLPEEHFLKQAAHTTSGLNTFRLMGHFLPANLVDIFTMSIKNGGVTGFFGDIVPTMLKLGTDSAFSKAIKEGAQDLGLATELATSHKLNSFFGLDNPYARGTAVTRATDYIAQNYSKYTGMAHMVEFIDKTAYATVHGRVMRLLDKVGAGKTLKQSDETFLNFIGLSTSDRTAILKQIEEHGTSVGRTKLSHPDKWADQKLADKFRAALYKELAGTSLRRTAGDSPKVAHTTTGRLITQFSTFMLAMNNKVTLAGLQRNDSKFLEGMTLMISAAMFGDYIVHVGSDKELPEDPAYWVSRAVDRSGIFAVPFYLNNAILDQNDLGINRIMKESGVTKEDYSFRGNSQLEALIGPTGGLVNDFSRSVSSWGDGEYTKADLKYPAKLLPFQNFILLERLFDQAIEGFGNATGAKERKSRETK